MKEKGDIVLIPFPFTDLKGSKKMPALILTENELDVTVCFISTQLNWSTTTDLLVQPEELNGLKKLHSLEPGKLQQLTKNY